jgi:ABC-type polysaccharide/polyol phosphate transport system ATPase subunit
MTTAKYYLKKCLDRKVANRKEIYLDHVIEEMLQDKLKVKIHEINSFCSVGTKIEFEIVKYLEECGHFNKLTQRGMVS